MKTKLLTLFFCLVSLFVKSQTIIVVDSVTSEILPYASISYQKDDTKNGVRISNIGYKTKNVINSVFGDTIRLNPVVYSLQEIEIQEKKRKANYYHLGFHNEKKLFYDTFTISALTYKVLAAAKFFGNDTLDAVEGVYLPLRNIDENSNFKLFIMSVGEEGLPKDTILKKLLNAKAYNRKAYIDLSEHALTIPSKGIFIVFEWGKKNYNYSRKLSIVTTKKSNTNFSYLFIKDRWIASNEITSKNEPHINFSFGFKMRKN